MRLFRLREAIRHAFDVTDEWARDIITAARRDPEARTVLGKYAREEIEVAVRARR